MTRRTPWEEYRRAFRVYLQWHACWMKTHDPHHLVLASACQRMAQEWLTIAHRQQQISATKFRYESSRLNKTPAEVPEWVGDERDVKARGKEADGVIAKVKRRQMSTAATISKLPIEAKAI